VGNLKPWLLLPLLFASVAVVAQEVSFPTDEQIVAAVEASSRPRGATTFWRSDAFGLIFGYDERWKPANPSQKSTAVVINWTSVKTGDVMATCYLEINNSEIGKLTPEQIRQKARHIADAFLRNGRLRDPNMQLINWRLATQDNHPVVYIERDMTVTNLNGTIHSRVYSVVTSWRGREVNMECASSIPVAMPKVAGVVEGPIRKVLGSMQFVRGE
jgi:hypothetical protein